MNIDEVDEKIKELKEVIDDLIIENKELKDVVAELKCDNENLSNEVDALEHLKFDKEEIAVEAFNSSWESRSSGITQLKAWLNYKIEAKL